MRSSDDFVIRFDSVTKRYAMEDIASVGVKNLLLRLPRHLRAFRERDHHTALQGVSFDVARGETLGIIGRNGSGKSTALGLVAGVLRPTSGTVRVRGRVCPLLELGAGFHHELTGLENALLNGVLLGMRRHEVRARLDAIVDFAELGAFIHQPVRTYSSGMVARLGFAVAVHVEPDVLLVDEVLSVGDEAFRAKCLAKMHAFRERGVTTVIVSHAMENVLEVSDRVALLDRGKLDCIGAPEEVVARYRAASGHRPGGAAEEEPG